MRKITNKTINVTTLKSPPPDKTAPPNISDNPHSSKWSRTAMTSI